MRVVQSGCDKEAKRRGFLLIDELTCGLQMTGREACHEECLCYFPSREEMNFLWFFRNAARGRTGAGASRLEEEDRNRQESQLMMMSAFRVLMRPFAQRIGLKEVGRGRARVEKVWRWSELQCGRLVRLSQPSLSSPRTYCVVIWCSCWRAMKNSHRLALNASLNATTFPRWTQSLMRTAKPPANVCWRLYKL